MYKIGFDAIKTYNMNSGLGQFCNSLAKELCKKNQHFKIDFIVKEINSALEFTTQRKLNIIERVAGVNNVNILHQTHQDSTLKTNNKKTKTILTIHDLNFLEKNYTPSKKKHKLSLIQKKINKATALVFISEYTKVLVNNYLNLNNKKQLVIYNGNTLNVNQQETPFDLIPKDSSFFFSIGMIQEKKNFHVLVPILNTFKNHYLIIAGDTSNSYVKKIILIAKELNVENKLILPGKITEAQKLWLYKNCDAFLFPSLAEGFGLPIIEALSVGAKVVSSTKCSLPEIGKEYIHYFNSFEPNEIGNELFNILSKTEQFSVQEKKEYAKTFSWENAANEYLNLYNSLL
jgi:glycosyltransferase involved in cell wall biosynthesis